MVLGMRWMALLSMLFVCAVLSAPTQIDKLSTTFKSDLVNHISDPNMKGYEEYVSHMKNGVKYVAGLGAALSVVAGNPAPLVLISTMLGTPAAIIGGRIGTRRYAAQEYQRNKDFLLKKFFRSEYHELVSSKFEKCAKKANEYTCDMLYNLNECGVDQSIFNFYSFASSDYLKDLLKSHVDDKLLSKDTYRQILSIPGLIIPGSDLSWALELLNNAFLVKNYNLAKALLEIKYVYRLANENDWLSPNLINLDFIRTVDTEAQEKLHEFVYGSSDFTWNPNWKPSINENGLLKDLLDNYVNQEGTLQQQFEEWINVAIAHPEFNPSEGKNAIISFMLSQSVALSFQKKYTLSEKLNGWITKCLNHDDFVVSGLNDPFVNDLVLYGDLLDEARIGDFVGLDWRRTLIDWIALVMEKDQNTKPSLNGIFNTWEEKYSQDKKHFVNQPRTMSIHDRPIQRAMI